MILLKINNVIPDEMIMINGKKKLVEVNEEVKIGFPNLKDKLAKKILLPSLTKSKLSCEILEFKKQAMLTK